MGLFLIAILLVAHAAALLIDLLLLLLLVRVVASRWRAAILLELNDASRPLVDRTLTGVERLWNQIRPVRRLHPNCRIPTAVLALSMVRLLLAAVTGLVVALG